MAKKTRPAGCFLNDLKAVRLSAFGKVWVSREGDRYYTWDHVHGEVEVFSKRGRHLGSADPITGVGIRKAVKGRKIDV